MELISSNVVLSNSILGVPCQCMIGNIVLHPVDCYKGCSHPTTNHEVTKFAVESSYFFVMIFYKLLFIFLQYAVMQRL